MEIYADQERSLRITTVGVLKNSLRLENYYNNRPGDQVRVANIEAFYAREDVQLVPGVLYIFNTYDRWYCYDGIHRYTAALSRESMSAIVSILNLPTEDRIQADFRNINQAVPVPMMYTEPQADLRLRAVYEETVKKLCSSFPDFVSKSFRCHKPNFNRDAMIDLLHEGLKESNTQLLNANALYDMLIRVNEIAKAKCMAPGGVPEGKKGREKSVTSGLWLFWLPPEEIMTEVRRLL